MKAKKVLIVDDNSLNRKVFEHIIGQIYEFGTASDGREALEKIKTGEFDLILMDIQMPNMSGLEATKIIRDLPEWATTPIIALTANAFTEDRRACLYTNDAIENGGCVRYRAGLFPASTGR